MSSRAVCYLLLRVSVCVLSCALLFSFGLHAVDVHHVHPGEQHTHHDSQSAVVSIALYAHMSEKKAVSAILSVFAFLGSVSVCAWTLHTLLGASVWNRIRRSPRVYNARALYSWERQLYSQGILEPKLH